MFLFSILEMKMLHTVSHTFATFWVQESYCQRGNRAKKRGCLRGRFIIPRNVGKNPQILRNPHRICSFDHIWV